MGSTRLFALLFECLPLIGVVAVIAASLWAGILFSISWLCGRARWMADSADVGSMAIALHRRWALPLLVTSLTSAFAWAYQAPRLALSPSRLFGIGAGIVVSVLVHMSVASRANRIARGSISATRGEGMRRFVLVASLMVVTTLICMRVKWP